MLSELAELAMQQARAAAAKSLAALAAEPGAAKTPDYGQLFNRLARTIQSLITHQARLTTTHPTPRAKITPPEPPPPDPRRTPIREAIHRLVQSHPDRALKRRAMGDRLDPLLAANPLQTNPEILAALCQECHVELNLRLLTDEQLGFPRATSPPQ